MVKDVAGWYPTKGSLDTHYFHNSNRPICEKDLIPCGHGHNTTLCIECLKELNEIGLLYKIGNLIIRFVDLLKLTSILKIPKYNARRMN